MMKKKVKKIPKYKEGTPFYNDANFYSQVGDFSMQQVNNIQQSKQGVTAGGIAKGALSGAAAGAVIGSIIPGIGTAAGAVGGALVGGITSSIGSGSKVNTNSSSTHFNEIYTPGSGIASLFDDDAAARIGANMVQNNNIAKIQTEQMRAKYAMDPNNPNGGSIMAAEGGIMRKPVDALVSKGELIYNPVTKKLSQVPGSKGKPNKADDVYTRLYEGDVVISNSPTMLMSNGKTPAQNLMGMVDKYSTGGTVKAREAIIKKVVNWQEANKTKPQEYAKFDEGTPKVRVRRKEPLQAVEWNGKTGYFTVDGGFIELPPNPALWPDSVYLGRYDYVDKNKVQKSSNKGVHTSNELNFNTSRHTRDGVNDKVVSKANKARRTPTQEEINAFYGYDREKVVETERKDRSERINNKNRKYLVENENENEMAGTLAEVVVTAPRINKASSKKDGKKSSSGKKTDVPQSQGATPTEVNQIGLDWARQEAARTMSQYAPNTTRPIAPGLVTPKIDPTETVEEAALPGSATKGPQGSTRTGLNGSNWRDGLYRMAVLSQPLWDRAEAEPVNYESPVYKYMPTQIDVSSQLRDADQSYALARYNFANLYPSTGAGMAAGLQAASNRAKQYADIRQWQTNAQNELIGKNVGIYNNWANEHARIMNEVYNKTAANRAAARNINRQNRSAALRNYGQMLSDDKKMAMERMKFNILKPAIKSTYEDATANDLINMYNSLFG